MLILLYSCEDPQGCDRICGMKIGIDGRMLSFPYTGVAQYIKNLVRELAEITPENEYVIVVPSRFNKESVNFPPNCVVHSLNEKKGSGSIGRVWWEQIQIPEFFAKEKIDLAWFPFPTNPWTKDRYKKGIKTVVTVHDCISWTNKKYTRSVLAKLYHYQRRRALKKADVVLTVSEASKKDIEKVCKVPAEKIFVVYNDADEDYKKVPNADFSEKVLNEFGLACERYFLYCGGYDERKNVDKLLEEYKIFAESKPEIPLVLVGEKLFNTRLYRSFNLALKEAGKVGKIIFTGFLLNEKLNVLYRNCAAYVNLTSAEGFNIPVIEAANCGAPLLLSDIEVHEELFKNHAIFIDLSKNGEASNHMREMLENFSLREKLVKKSLDLSKKFSWKSSAQKAKEVLFS